MNKDNYVVRASIASLAALGLHDLEIKFPMHTLYLLQYSREGCLAGCLFCSQSRMCPIDKKFLSRITWPTIQLNRFIEALKDRERDVRRICIQSILKRGFIQEIIDIVDHIRSQGIDKPISVAVTPVSRKYLYCLRDLGVDYIGIGLDTSSPQLFRVMGKPYSWRVYMDFIRDAVSVFGEKHVYVHLIVGLGEKPKEIIDTIYKLIGMGASIALFAYTPLRGLRLKLERPSIGYYRSIQILLYYLNMGYRPSDIVYIDNGRILVKRDIIDAIINEVDRYLKVFLTTGCPYCNRPYYNESPRGPFYNYYSIDHVLRYIDELRNELLMIRGDR